jgi:YesN/AraC family two-component response regulator
MKGLGTGSFLEDDLVLLDDMSEAPIPRDPRRMNRIVVALCTHGRAQYTIDTQEQMVKANEILIISEGHILDNFMASPDLEGLCFILTANFFNEIIKNVSDVSALFLFSRYHPVVSVSSREAEVFKSYFAMIKERTANTENYFRRDAVRTLLLAMFYDLSNVLYQSSRDVHMRHKRSDMVFTQFIKLVEENCRQERRVSWYAQQLCITPKYLSELVKQCSKRTPNDWIDNYVTLEVRNMLKNSNKSVKQIAEDMHFPNQSFLGKYFKERVGMSPSKYRRFG